MSQVFLAVNGDGVGDKIGSAIINDNHEELSQVSNAIKQAHQMLEEWVTSHGGKVVVSSGDDAIYHIPSQALGEFDQVRQRYSEMAGTTLTAGVGNSMSESSKALIYGKLNDKNQVVEYSPEIEAQLSSEEEGEIPSQQDVVSEGDSQHEVEQGLESEDEESDANSQDGEEDFEEDFEEEDEESNEDFEDEDSLDPNIEEDDEVEFTHEGEEESEDEFEQDPSSEEFEDESEESEFEEETPIQDEESDSFVSQGDEEGLEEESESEFEDEESEDPSMQGDSDEEIEGESDEGEWIDADEDVDGEEELSEEDLHDWEDEEQDPSSEEFEDGDDSDTMSDMLHANLEDDGSESEFEDEESEGYSDEVRADIIESLQAFKNNKMQIEEMQATNPELYQAMILNLRSMIEMAKELGIDTEEAEQEQDEFEDPSMQDPNAQGQGGGLPTPEQLMGKSEKGVHKPYSGKGDGSSIAGDIARQGKSSPKHKEMARKMHSEKLKEMKEIKPNLPKSEKNTSNLNKGDVLNLPPKKKGTITLKPHPKEVQDVDPKIISDMKSRLKEAKENKNKPREKVRDHLDDSVQSQVKKKEGDLKKLKGKS